VDPFPLHLLEASVKIKIRLESYENQRYQEYVNLIETGMVPNPSSENDISNINSGPQVSYCTTLIRAGFYNLFGAAMAEAKPLTKKEEKLEKEEDFM